MSDEERKTPRAKVAVDAQPTTRDEVSYEAKVLPEPDPAPAADDPGATGSHAFREGVGRVTGWVSAHFPGHENAFVGGVLGLVAAILIFSIGLLRALVICLLILVGVAVGQAVDGDPKIINAIRKFVTDRTE